MGLIDNMGKSERIEQLEQQNAELQSQLRIYKNVASGIADERVVSNELLELENKNTEIDRLTRDVNRLYLFRNVVSELLDTDMHTQLTLDKRDKDFSEITISRNAVAT